MGGAGKESRERRPSSSGRGLNLKPDTWRIEWGWLDSGAWFCGAPASIRPKGEPSEQFTGTTSSESPCASNPFTPAGEKLSESTASDVRELCNTLLNAYLIQLLDTGFLHADPHPGNLIRTPDGK